MEVTGNQVEVSTNSELMRQARESLKDIWLIAIVTFVIYLLILGGLQGIPRVGPFLSFVLSGPFGLGAAIFSLAIARDAEPRMEMIFDGFKNFKTSLFAYVIMVVFILLWTIILIIPGIIAALSYSMTYFIIADNSSIEPMEAIEKSKEMMKGHKWKLFYLYLIFFGLALLCILTLGIGFFWYIPFVQVTLAKFYEDIKPESKGSVSDTDESIETI